ncbi:uncharacterized protein LOC120546791 [Perca fluviatilis]|uniref:uncharacterized protein LOC120546791 n=1 Tax=Perca fluviatilis TaxID=8168 RepID=UPI0019659911|nr:uncharacterized protein LOC120546791 [Perca fluviatilis]
MRATLNQYDPAHRIFQIDHYTNGVILGGSSEQMNRHLMRKVNLDTFDAAVSFVNVNNNHWRFVYLHAPLRTLFVMDPATAEQDFHLSTTAVQRYNRYFQMRQNVYGKQVWSSIKWKAATTPHPVQKDSTSCGVFVMQMAKEAIKSFPAIPSFTMKTTPRAMSRLRAEMAAELLSASEKDYGSMCGLEDVPRDTNINAVVIDWTQCDSCRRWFHDFCYSKSWTQNIMVRRQKTVNIERCEPQVLHYVDGANITLTLIQ